MVFHHDRLEATSSVNVPQLNARDVVGDGALSLSHRGDRVCRDKEEFGIVVDEALDQPRTGNPVDICILSGDPLHLGNSLKDPAGCTELPVLFDNGLLGRHSWSLSI